MAKKAAGKSRNGDEPPAPKKVTRERKGKQTVTPEYLTKRATTLQSYADSLRDAVKKMKEEGHESLEVMNVPTSETGLAKVRDMIASVKRELGDV